MAATAGEPVRNYEARYRGRRDRSANGGGRRPRKSRGGSRKVLASSAPECKNKSDRLQLSICSLDSVKATQGLEDDGDLADMPESIDEGRLEHRLENGSSPSLMRVAQAESLTKSFLDGDATMDDPIGHPIKSVLVSRPTARKSCSTRTQPARKVAAVAKSILGHKGKNGLVNGSLTKSSQLRLKGATMAPKDIGEMTFGHQRPNDILSTFPFNVADSRLPLVVLNQMPGAENDIFDVQYGAGGNSSCCGGGGGDPSRPPSASSSSLRKVELGKSHLEPLDAELGVLLPKLSEMEMVLTGDDAWQSEVSLSPEMPILSPNIDGGEPTDLVDGRNSAGRRMPICDVQALLSDEDQECHRLDEEATLLDDGEPKWKRPRKEMIRPFGSRKVKSWMQRRKCRLSCPDIDVVDGMEFLSFECEKDLERFMRNNPSSLCRGTPPPPVIPAAASTSSSSSSSLFPELLAHLLMNGQPTKKAKGFGRAIMPTKTTDITRIKGWRNKIFAVEALAKCRFDPNVVRKLSWSQRMCLLSNFSREELEERGLLDLMSISYSQYVKDEDIVTVVNSRESSTAKTLELPDVNVHVSLSSPVNVASPPRNASHPVNNAVSPVNSGTPVKNENPVSNISPANNANPVNRPNASFVKSDKPIGSAMCSVSPVCNPSPVSNASPTKASPASKASSGSPMKGIREIYDPNCEENESYLLDDYSKEPAGVHEDELDRQSIESIDLGIFRSEPFDDEDFIEQPTADIPDPLVSVSPNPAFVQEVLPNKSVFVSEYLDNFLKNQSTLNVSLTKSMERTVNPDEIQTKVVWPTQEMPVQSEVPARALFGDRVRAQIVKRNPVGRPRLKPSGGIRGRYNKKFIMKPRGRPRLSTYKVKSRTNTVVQQRSVAAAADQLANGVEAVIMSRADALFAVTALVRRNYVDDCDSYLLDTAEDIEEAMNQVCTRTESVEQIRKLKYGEFSVLLSRNHVSRAVAAVVDLPTCHSSLPKSEQPSADDDDDGDKQEEEAVVNDKPSPPRPCEKKSPVTAWKVAPVSSSMLPQSLLPTITLTKVSTASTVKPHGVVANGCQEEFCRMGCVCDSLKVRKRNRGHCGKVCCMFGCSCDTHPFGTTDPSDNSNKVDDTHTRASRRREIKLPARLRDSVYFYKEDLTAVNVTKAVHAKKFKKMLLMSSLQASTSPSPPPPSPQWTPPQGLSALRNQNSSDPLKNFVRRPQMYPLAFRKSKIKQISRVDAEAYEHLKQSKSPPVQSKKKRIRNKNVNGGDGGVGGEGDGGGDSFIFEPQLGIRPRIRQPPFFLFGPDEMILSRIPSIPEEAPSVSAANRPKLMDLQKMKHVNPVVKPAASRSMPTILRRSMEKSISSPHKSLPASACTATVQRVLLQKFRLPHGTGDDNEDQDKGEEPQPQSPKKIVSPVHRFGIRTARKSLNPSALCRTTLPKPGNPRTRADRVDIVVKNLVEEIVHKVAFRLEVGEFWQMRDKYVRRARISCFRSASSSVVQQLPFRKKLQQHQMTVKNSSSASSSGARRASKTMSLVSAKRKKTTPSLQSASAQPQPPQPASVVESDDEIMCVGHVENVPPKPIARVARAGQQTISASSPQPKHAKGQREQQRRNAILMAFTNLAMVSSPVVKDIWSKKDESVPITAFVFKMSSAAIQRLQDQEKSLYAIKQALIRRRMLLFNKYSEYLKDYSPEKQRIAIRELSKKIADCCHDRSEPSSSTANDVALPANMMLPISVVRIPPAASVSKTIPCASVPSVPSFSIPSVSTVSIPPIAVAARKITPPETINLSGESVPSDEDVDVMEVMPNVRSAENPVVETGNNFGEGDAIGRVGSKRILVGEPMLIGDLSGQNPRAASAAEADASDELNEDAMGPVRTIRLQRPVGASEWVAVNSSRETANQRVSSTAGPPLPRILTLSVSGMHKKEQSLTGTNAPLAASAVIATPGGVAASNVAVNTNSTTFFNTRTVPMPSVRCVTNVVTRTPTPTGAAAAVLKPSIPTLFTFTSPSGYSHAMTRLLLNPVTLSGVRLMSPNNVSTVAATATTKTVTGVDFTNAGKLVMRARTFRKVATTTTASMPIPSDNGVSTDATQTFVRVPLLQAIGNSGKDHSSAKFVIGMIPSTTVSSNGMVSTTDSTASGGVLMSPCVTKKRQQLVTIPIPMVGRPFTLDNKQGLLIMKANHATPAVGSTASDQLQLPERAAVAKSDEEDTLLMTSAQKLIQQVRSGPAVPLMATLTNNDNNSARGLSPAAADQNIVKMKKGHPSVFAPRRPCYCPVPPPTMTTIKAAFEDNKLTPSRNVPVAAVAVATTTTTKTTVVAGTKSAAQSLPAVSTTVLPTSTVTVAGSKLAPLNPVAVPSAAPMTMGASAITVSESKEVIAGGSVLSPAWPK